MGARSGALLKWPRGSSTSASGRTSMIPCVTARRSVLLAGTIAGVLLAAPAFAQQSTPSDPPAAAPAAPMAAPAAPAAPAAAPPAAMPAPTPAAAQPLPPGSPMIGRPDGNPAAAKL